jgi:diguanylate cyclase (GGDEF)-like protein
VSTQVRRPAADQGAVTFPHRLLPAGPLARTRLGALIMGCLAIVVQLAQVGNVTKSATYHLLSAGAICALWGILVLTHARGRTAWWDVLAVPPLVVLGGSGLIDPIAGVSLALAVSVVLSLYGSTRLWILRTVGGTVAVPLGVALSPVSAGRSLDWNSPTVIGVLPQMILVSVLIRGIYAALRRQETSTARESVLARAGRQMLAATDVSQMRVYGIGAAEELVALSPRVAQVILRRTPGGMVVHNLAGLPASLTGTPVPDSVVAEPAVLGRLAPGMPHWRMETFDDDLHVAVGGARPVPDEIFDGFLNLSHQVMLGEAGIRSRAELDHRAHHDHLTGLPNRARFFRELAAAGDAAPGTVALLNIDLDDFKQVNDSYGHAAGDELLVRVAERIAGVGGLAARYGGDEFALLLTGLREPGEAERVATALCRRLAAPIQLTGATVTAGASIGVAVTMPGLTAADLTRCADVAMYSAKARGKDRVAVFHPDQHSGAVHRRPGVAAALLS